MLIEYIPYGDLLGFLRKSRGLKDNYYKNPDIKPKTTLTSQQLIQFAWQIADGMEFLSSNKVRAKSERFIVILYSITYRHSPLSRNCPWLQSWTKSVKNFALSHTQETHPTYLEPW